MDELKNEAWANSPPWPPEDPDSPFRVDGQFVLVWSLYQDVDAPIGAWTVAHRTHPVRGDLCPFAVAFIRNEGWEKYGKQLELPLDAAA